MTTTRLPFRLLMRLRDALLMRSRRNRSMAAVARIIGPNDFARLLVRKGIERGVLEELEHWTEEQLEVTYSLRLGGTGSMT
jgi:hypothetical protein